MANPILVSVGNVLIINKDTNTAMYQGKANITSAFDIKMSAADARGGVNNPLLYSYYHTREVNLKVEVQTMDETILAMNVGSSVNSGAYNVLWTECIQLSSGSGVLTYTPVGNVDVFLQNGNIQNVTPSSKNIYVAAGANTAVTVYYTTSKTITQVTVGSTTPPSNVECYLTAEIREKGSGNAVYKYLQIHIPAFQLTGSFNLAMAANGVSKQMMEGRALVTNSTDCTSGDYFAKVSFIPVSATISYSSIGVLGTLSFAAGVSSSEQVSVWGIQGGNIGNTNITTSSVFSMVPNGNSGSPNITVSAGGLVTAGSSGSSGNSATLQALYVDAISGSLYDQRVVRIS
jgi:hypothetical protein